MLGESSRALLLIGIGFLLMAGGLPISSPAMFGFLMNLAHDEGWPWLFAGLFVGFFTVAGHAISYAAFRQFRPFIWNRVIRRYPSVLRVVSRIRPGKEKGAFNPALLLLRWIGVGYSQVFWVLGLSGDDASRTLRILFLADLLWASVWSFALTKLLVGAPVVGRYLTGFGWALLIFSAVGYAFRHILRQKTG
ncbi:MAG: hypothetical protein QM391_03465 [Bacillota bacterium]|jgi:hypothetical protein|nr:hypothetical protein [Bacillota bacterium]MDI9415094.1 hypothetical protein [Bacillota bacterium]NLD13157.1 hypothetical protein [Bacillota bacterium]HCD42109.1 hypothetical protein [Bacillota bacterium]HOB89176.1 hypothetical protein [Bacillota bacterium]